jgi:hypothetical protein
MVDNYEERKKEKIERYRDLAEKNRKEGDARIEQARGMASVIPLGQPILVGHHSEKSDRSFRARIDNNYRKGFEHHDKADYYERRAAAAESDHAISSDDPKAVEKLEMRIADLEQEQQHMKDVNKIVKARKKAYTREQRIADLITLGIPAGVVPKLFEPDCLGRTGYPDFMLTNNNGNIRRLKQRVEYLRTMESQQTTERTIENTPIGDIQIVDNVEANRLQIFFQGKPADEIRTALKRNGFRWSPRNACWQAYRGNRSEYGLEMVLVEVGGE